LFPISGISFPFWEQTPGLKDSAAGYIPTLDGWRAIAILLVLLEHGSFRTFGPIGWTRLGGHGVEIFFVLSGFLITGKLLEEGSLRKFYLRRAFRILPIVFAYLGAVVTLGLIFHRIPLSWGEISASLLFVRNYRFIPSPGSGAGWFTAHLWSLSIEEQFYIFWPLVLLKVGKGAPRRQALGAAMLFAFCGCVLLLVHFARVMHLGGYYWMPNISFSGLIVGCLLRIAFSDAIWMSALTTVLSGRSLRAAIGLLIYILVFHAQLTIFDPLICGLAVGATVLEPRAWVGRVLEFPALRWIGRLSYSLYIWQQLFLGFGVNFRPFGFLSAFPINLASTVAMACISYYLLERPMMQWGHSLARGRGRPLAASPVVVAVGVGPTQEMTEAAALGD
jgi:peptidoglycan/LPS O-acetylase OafA/YrhL